MEKSNRFRAPFMTAPTLEPLLIVVLSNAAGSCGYRYVDRLMKRPSPVMEKERDNYYDSDLSQKLPRYSLITKYHELGTLGPNYNASGMVVQFLR